MKGCKKPKRTPQINQLLVELHNNLALCMFQKQNYKETMKISEATLRTDPENVKGYVQVDTTAKGDKVGEVENAVKVIKECLRATVHNTPFRRVPKIFIVELVRNTVYWLNQFPSRRDSITGTMSPAEIMEGYGKPNGNQIVFEYGGFDTQCK